VKKQKELFRAYLKGNPNPAWSDIINALVKIRKDDIAKKVIDTFNLSPKLLATAPKWMSGESIIPSSSLGARVEPDTAELVPARVSKPDPRIEPDGGIFSVADAATFTPVSKGVSKTEVLSSKKLDRPHTDPRKPQPRQPRIVSDDGGGGSSPAEETDSYFPMVERESASLPPEGDRELQSIQMRFSSDPMGGDSNSSVSGALSFRQEVQQSSRDSSPSSSDFHSAEEAPLEEPDSSSQKTTKSHRDVPRSPALVSVHEIVRLDC
jgi:hypothetical protein